MMNTKVKCTRVYKTMDINGFEEDKVYDIVKGKLILPNGNKSNTTFESVEQLNESFYACFKEIKEE